MKTVNITKFKQSCLNLLLPKNIQREPILILKHGKAAAFVTTAERFPKKKKVKLKGSVTFLKKNIEYINNLYETNQTLSARARTPS